MAQALAPTGHSKLGASSADRWLNCTGSVRAQEGKPNVTSSFAQEGTDLHEVSALCLTNNQDAIEYAGRTVGKTEIDDSHVDATQVYLDTIRNSTPLPGVLRIFDAKFGKGVVVEVVKPNGRVNPQLGYYALGALDALAGKPAGNYVETRFHLKSLHPLFFGTCDYVQWPGGRIDKIELIIVQPRAPHRDGPVRSVTVDHVDLMDLAGDLVEAAHKALSDDATLNPGDWCQFCKAAGTCEAVARKALDVAQLDFDDELAPLQSKLPQPADMSNAKIAYLLKAADFLDAWVGAVRAEGLHRAQAGETIPEHKLVAKRGRRRWVGDEASAAMALLLEFGLDEKDIYNRKLKSPAEIEKLVGKKSFKSFDDVEKVSSGFNLVPISDDRPAKIAGPDADFDEWSGS